MATSGQWQTSSQFSQGQEGREERLGKRTHRDSQMVLSAICYCGGNGAMPRPVRFRFNWGCFHLRVGCAMHARVVFIVILRISGAKLAPRSWRHGWRPVRPRSACCPFPGGVWPLASWIRRVGWQGFRRANLPPPASTTTWRRAPTRDASE